MKPPVQSINHPSHCSALFPEVVFAFRKHPNSATIGNKNANREQCAQKHAIENQYRNANNKRTFREFMTKTATTERSELVATFENMTKPATFVINVYKIQPWEIEKKHRKSVVKANNLAKRSREDNEKMITKPNKLGRKVFLVAGFSEYHFLDGVTWLGFLHPPLAHKACARPLRRGRPEKTPKTRCKS